MAFPVTINPASPAGSDSPSAGDDQIRALKQAIIDIFGLPSSPDAISAATSVTGTGGGLTSTRFTETTDPSAPAANDLVVYASDEGGLTTLTVRDSASPIGSVSYFIRDAAEATTATGSAADIKTITVNIPVTAAFRVSFSLRKTAGAAAAPTIGMKMNATQVFANTAIFSAANQAENGFAYTEIITARSSANYLRPGADLVMRNAIGPVTASPAPTADYPNATLTSIVITGSSVSASVTLAVANVIVEVFP